MRVRATGWDHPLRHIASIAKDIDLSMLSPGPARLYFGIQDDDEADGE